jgi:hypothetical protein
VGLVTLERRTATAIRHVYHVDARHHLDTCSNHRCRMGADCRELQALGLRGNRSPLPRKERPVCGARNRQGKPGGRPVEVIRFRITEAGRRVLAELRWP